MSLRIAFDLDGVLADMEAELVRQAELLFGEPMTRLLERRAGAVAAESRRASEGTEPEARHLEPSITSADESIEEALPVLRLEMTSRQQRRLWRHVESIDKFWESLKEIEPGAIARLGRLATERRWEVIFLTKRPDSTGATAQLQTQRWLEAKGFTLPSVYVVQGSRGRIAAALGLDFVVDDRPENCLDVVVDSKARAVLVWRGAEEQLPAAARRLGIGVVGSVNECLDILSEIDAAIEERPGMVNRVMRMLGLKETASV